MGQATAARRLWEHVRRERLRPHGEPLADLGDHAAAHEPGASAALVPPPPLGRAGELYVQAAARVTDHFRRATVGGLAVATVIATAVSVSGHPARGPWLVTGLVTAMYALLWALRRRPRYATMVALGFLELVLVAGLLTFGPAAGAGVVATLAVLLCAIQFGAEASFAAAAFATVLFVTVGALVHDRDGRKVESLAVWIRAGVTTGTLAAFVGMATSSLLGSLRDALAKLERVQAEREREQAELSRRREFETAGRLVSGVVHDVNNSLTVVMCCVEELREQELSPTGRELVADLDSTTVAAGGTMRAMLDFVRPTTDEVQHCDPARVIGEVARNLARLLPEDVELSTSLVEGRTVALSRGALLHATVNLVLNARDALDGARKQIAIAVEPSDVAVVVSVRDTGSGMDAATVARLGEALFSTKGAAGTGLGLTNVRATVEGCGGRVEIESELGRGTEVRLVLPMVDVASAAAAATSVARLGGLRVLLVEDDDAIRRAFTRGLAAAGAVVVEAASVERAHAMLADGPAFAALVCDGVLRDGTVADVLPVFRDRWPTAAVVLCTGHGLELFAARGLALGDHRVVTKPVTGAQLARAVAAALGDGATTAVTGDPVTPAVSARSGAMA